MNFKQFRFCICCGLLLAMVATAANGQQVPPAQLAGNNQAMQQDNSDRKQQGSHGGAIKQIDEFQLETLVTAGGIQLFVRDRAGQAVNVDRARGSALLSVSHAAKRFRYDLLPDGKGALEARINLSKLAGKQIELEIQIVGLAERSTQPVSFTEVATVPASEEQLAARAIAIQKTCPVTNKPLGSMGAPVPIEIEGKQLFVCCAGCTKAVQANPGKYLAGRPQVTVGEITAADKPLIANQANCPVMDEPLESMGGPIKVMVDDTPIFLCCRGCIKKVQAEPLKFVSKLYGEPSLGTVPADGEQIREGIYKVTSADAPFIAAQKRCPIMDEPLDSMGGPYRVHANGKAIYICCPGCAKKIAAEPQTYLDLLEKQGIQAPTVALEPT